MLGDTCKCTNYALLGSLELRDEIVKTLGDKSNSCIIYSHGAVFVGTDMDEAFRESTALEVTAQILTLIESTGENPVGICKENIKAMQYHVANKYGQVK